MLKPEYFEDGYDFHPVIREIISRIHTEGPVDGSSLETLAFIINVGHTKVSYSFLEALSSSHLGNSGKHTVK